MDTESPKQPSDAKRARESIRSRIFHFLLGFCGTGILWLFYMGRLNANNFRGTDLILIALLLTSLIVCWKSPSRWTFYGVATAVLLPVIGLLLIFGSCLILGGRIAG